MSVLVLAEIDDKGVAPQTLNAVTAAVQIGGDVHILLAGSDCGAQAEAAAKIAGVAKILKADNVAYATGLAENVANLVTSLAGGYSHLLVAATSFGKNVMPRVAALLDVQQISEIIDIKDSDTFVRPIYAGNALATVKSSDAIKAITVRATAFEAAEATTRAEAGRASASASSSEAAAAAALPPPPLDSSLRFRRASASSALNFSYSGNCTATCATPTSEGRAPAHSPAAPSSRAIRTSASAVPL